MRTERTGKFARTVPRPVALAFLLLALGGCAPAVLGPDREAFRAVDALYTAVSLRDPALLSRCESTLNELGAAGKVPADAGHALGAIVSEARGGAWESAQGRLAAFMEGQRR